MLSIEDIYCQFSRGSDGFCRAVETHCGFDITRAQIGRIAERARTADEFVHIWENSVWWKMPSLVEAITSTHTV